MTRVIAWIDRYARIGVSDLPKGQRSARYAFNTLCLLGFTAAALYTALYTFVGLRPMALTAVGVASVAALPYAAKYSERLAALLGILICCLGFCTLTYFAGRDSLLHFFILLAVVNLVILQGARAPVEAALGAAVCTIVVVLCHIWFPEPALGDAISDQFVAFLATVGILSLGTLAAGVLILLSQQVRAAQDALAAEHARSEALLDNLLPTEIAMRLKSAPGEIIADDLPAVTILFADIVDFTPRANSMPPEEVVTFLNSVFTEFDRLTELHGLEKIKTIGDAYMVAAGMPVARADHAEAIADMALDMLAVTRELSARAHQPIEVRIGLHTGSAIAGVIGTQKVFYDVWGDTVNTASRMESQGEIGRIQLTADTKDQLGDGYLFEERGMVEIKGKGRIRTFWLTGKASYSSPVDSKAANASA